MRPARDIYLLRAGTKRLPDFDQLEPVGAIDISVLTDPPQNTFRLGFPGVENRYDWFAIDYNGRFYVIDGLPSSAGSTGSIKLAGGIHRIRVSYFQGPCMNHIGDGVRLQLGVKPPGAPDFPFFSTDEFRPPDDPKDWKYGRP